MGGNSERKSTRQSWEEAQMQRAIDAVNSGEMGWLRASKQFSVPQATLRRRARNKNKIFNGVEKGLGRFQPTFSRELERELIDHLKLLESRLFGMSVAEVRQLAFQIAEVNGIDHRFNKEKKMAGWDWVAGFLKRNSGISLRKPEATSAARAAGFNKPVVQQFFTIYEEVLKKEGISPCNIYNMDESSLTTAQKTVKVFAQTGKKQVGALTSAERGVHVTVVCCMGPSGFIPPMLIYPRKNWKKELTDGAPLGTVGVAQETGWMTGEIFVQWLKHFCSFVKPTMENKVILLLDGHASHKNYEAVSYAKENGIILVCFPAHCTHRLQPLDVSFYGPLKTYYDQEATRWLKCNPGRTVSQYQICPLFAKAYGKAATIAIAESGFEHTGLWPLNPDIFPDHLFAPAATTDIPMSEPRMNQPEIPTGPVTLSVNGESGTIEQPNEQNPKTANVVNKDDSKQKTSSSPTVPITNISPVPSISSRRPNGIQRRQTSKKTPTVLTKSPYVKELRQKSQEKLEKEKRVAAQKARKQLNFGEEIFYEKELFDDLADDSDDCPCLYCNELYSQSRPGEHWLKCQQCKKWAHTECAGLRNRAKNFVCDVCK